MRDATVALKNILSGKNDEISKKEKELADLKKQISELEIKFTNNNALLQKAKANNDVEIAEDKAKKSASALKEVTAVYQNKLNEVLEEHKKRLDALNEGIEWDKKALETAFRNVLKEHNEMLKTREKIVEDRLSDVEKAREKYEKELETIQNIEERKADLKLREDAISRRERVVDKAIEKGVAREHSSMLLELEGLKKIRSDYESRMSELSFEYNALLAKSTELETLDKEKCIEENKSLRKQILEMKKTFKYEGEQLRDLEEQAAKCKEYYEANRRLIAEKIELEDQVIKLRNEKMNADSLVAQKETLIEQINVERLYLKQLKEEIEMLSLRIDGRRGDIVASEAIETVIEDFKGNEQEKRTNINEISWIDSIISNCEASGFKFSKRLFYSFHTCLKTSDMSPLTVLAGVSGTGKSKLPQLYSKFGGLYFISVPVQPDWDSPQSLFGYFNSIEKRFNATTLLRALVSFQKDKSKSESKENIYDLSDNVLIVLLDEMNLAHVELYFSDLLSKLEERRGETKDVSFEVDLGAGHEKYKVCLTENVKWVGTMNEDETTKSLSDKVIDRGNIISFTRPDDFVRYRKKEELNYSPKISKFQWESWVDDKYELNEEEANIYMNIVKGINNAMKNVNRALGHRVWQAIEDYIVSHPLVKKYKDDKEKRTKALNYAFEEALVQKVMPKLRGIDTEGKYRSECLDVILDILKSNNLSTIVPDYEKAMESVTETFVWDSATYLNEEYKIEE